jgi:hypothetical protein
MSQVMHTLVDDYQLNWPDQLPLVEFTMNSAINESTGYAPFELNYRWMPKLMHHRRVLQSRYGLLHYAYLIHRTGPAHLFLSTY